MKTYNENAIINKACLIVRRIQNYYDDVNVVKNIKELKISLTLQELMDKEDKINKFYNNIEYPEFIEDNNYQDKAILPSNIDVFYDEHGLYEFPLYFPIALMLQVGDVINLRDFDYDFFTEPEYRNCYNEDLFDNIRYYIFSNKNYQRFVILSRIFCFNRNLIILEGILL